MRIRLSEEDQKRLGCAEWLAVDVGKMTNREAAVIQKVLGFDSIIDLGEAWRDQWREPADGSGEGRVKLDYDAWDALVWLALRQAGALTAKTREELHAELDGLEYEVTALRLEADDEPGKETASSSTPTTTSND